MLLLGSILVAVAGIVILATSGGSGGGVVNAQGTNPFSPGPGVSPLPSPVTQPTRLFSGRDPFEPPPGLSTTSPPISPTPPVTTFPSITPPSTVPHTVSPPPSPPSHPGGGSSTTIGGHTVVLDDVFTANGAQKVQVEVDGLVYTVGEGQRFDGNFKLTNVHDSCADFLFGDRSFTLCSTAHK